MRRTALALLLCCMFLAATSQVGHCVEIAIDADSSAGSMNTRLFGHNTVYMNGVEGLWDNNTWALKPSAQASMVKAGTGAEALIRFPGGNHNDTYH